MSRETIRYTADVVLLSTDEAGQRSVLLVQRRYDPYAGMWALPGGHVEHDETVRQAAVRELREETGLGLPEAALELIGVYDKPGRDPRGRYVTVAFVAFVAPVGRVAAVAGDDAERAEWLPTGHELAFDHNAIVGDAIARLDQMWPWTIAGAVGQVAGPAHGTVACFYSGCPCAACQATGLVYVRARITGSPLTEGDIDRCASRTCSRCGSTDLYPRRCSQCGQRWIDMACGPTHALIAAELGLINR